MAAAEGGLVREEEHEDPSEEEEHEVPAGLLAHHLHGELWAILDTASKQALRLTSKALRDEVEQRCVRLRPESRSMPGCMEASVLRAMHPRLPALRSLTCFSIEALEEVFVPAKEEQEEEEERHKEKKDEKEEEDKEEEKEDSPAEDGRRRRKEAGEEANPKQQLHKEAVPSSSEGMRGRPWPRLTSLSVLLTLECTPGQLSFLCASAALRPLLAELCLSGSVHISESHLRQAGLHLLPR